MEAEFKRKRWANMTLKKSGSSKRKDINPVKSLSKESVRNGLDERQTHEVIQLFGTKPEEQGEHERQAARLLDAAQTDNFHVIQEIQKEGFGSPRRPYPDA